MLEQSLAQDWRDGPVDGPLYSVVTRCELLLVNRVTAGEGGVVNGAPKSTTTKT